MMPTKNNNMQTISLINDLSVVIRISQCSIKIEMVKGNMTELRGIIDGPPGTAYEGGKFNLDIQVPDMYPFTPPKVS